MSRARKLGVSVLSVVAVLIPVTIGQAQGFGASAVVASRAGAGAGAAFAMTNVTAGNRIVVYERSAAGALTRVDSVSTRGKGIGTDLDTQGSLQLSDDHRFLYATNAGSDNISVFAVRGAHLRFLQKIAAGDAPNSITIHGRLLYVLDGSVAGNGIRGFRIRANGKLRSLANSFRLLSSPIAVPGQVAFSPDGKALLVTQKTTNVLLSPQNAIDVFAVAGNGLASLTPVRNSSHGVRPFSLAFRADGTLLVTESFNAAPGMSAVSSYRFSGQDVTVTSGSVPNHQTDVCWVVITADGRYAYTANFGSGTISSYAIGATGQIRLIDGSAASLGALSQPVDLAQGADSHFLYLLLRGTGAVAGFKIQRDGGLRPLGIVKGGLPVADGASGLAAF